MHALLGHLYHLALHVLTHPGFQACAATGIIAALGRLARPRLAAGVAVFSGWCLLTWPFLLVWPLPPVARLPGAAALLVFAGMVEGATAAPARRAGQRGKGARRPAPSHAATRWWAWPLVCLLLAWWLRGAPLSDNGILRGMALFLGLLAAWGVARRLARADQGWATLAASVALAGSLPLAGVSPHWMTMALIPATAGIMLLGVPDAVPALLATTVVVAASAIVASDRGRLVPADAACLVPLLALSLAPRLLRRTPPAGAALAAAVCVALTWAVTWTVS